MSTTSTTTTTGGQLETLPDDRSRAMLWGAPFVLGLAILLLGVLAFIATSVTGLASILLFGALFIGGGTAQVVHAFRERRGRDGLALHLLGGLFSIVVGLVFWARPLAGLAALTLVLAAYLLCMGLARAVTAVADRYDNWGWDAAYGLLALVLGAMVIASWPLSALWVIGALVGAELIFRGAAMMGLALGVRRQLHGRQAARLHQRPTAGPTSPPAARPGGLPSELPAT